MQIIKKPRNESITIDPDRYVERDNDSFSFTRAEKSKLMDIQDGANSGTTTTYMGTEPPELAMIWLDTTVEL